MGNPDSDGNMPNRARYHVPAAIQKHVDYITPGIKLFASPRKKDERKKIEKRTFDITKPGRPTKPQPPLKFPLPMSVGQLTSAAASASLAICDVAITPACVRALYNITKPTKAAPGNQLGIFESIGDVYAQEDLDLFFLSLAT